MQQIQNRIKAAGALVPGTCWIDPRSFRTPGPRLEVGRTAAGTQKQSFKILVRNAILFHPLLVDCRLHSPHSPKGTWPKCHMSMGTRFMTNISYIYVLGRTHWIDSPRPRPHGCTECSCNTEHQYQWLGHPLETKYNLETFFLSSASPEFGSMSGRGIMTKPRSIIALHAGLSGGFYRMCPELPVEV